MCLLLQGGLESSNRPGTMAVQLSGRMMVVLLGGMLTVWLVSYSPLLARLWPILRGSCTPVPGPESRWADVWGMGWLRFHNQLVREVQRADQGQVPTLAVLLLGDQWTLQHGSCMHVLGEGCACCMARLCGHQNVCLDVHASCARADSQPGLQALRGLVERTAGLRADLLRGQHL